MLKALVEHVSRQGFQGTDRKSVWVTLMLQNGTVLAGTLISPEQFAAENAEENGGSCPSDFAFEEPFPADYVHLSDVHVLSGPSWVRLGTMRVAIDDVQCCGDNHRPRV